MSAHVPALPLEADPLIAEAKQRARRRRLVAAAALATTGAAVWGLLASSGGGSSGEIPWLPTRPQLGAANPPLAPACTASQLRAKLELQGATGNLAGGISITNRSSQPCALVGRPRLSFVGATSKWRVTRLHDPSPFDPLAPPVGSLRALAPGRWVSVGLFWSSWCGRGSTAAGNPGEPPAGIGLKAPGGGTVVLRQNRIGGGRRPLGAPPCFFSPSKLGATRFTPYVPQGPPSSELPLRVRILPLAIARPGSWLSYSLVLTNRSARPFSFGRTCPAYIESVVGSRQAAYILNCDAVRTIAPRASVRLAMRIRIPSDLRLGDTNTLVWNLAPHSWNAPSAQMSLQVR